MGRFTLPNWLLRYAEKPIAKDHKIVAKYMREPSEMRR
jgi:hypothetical protein